MLILAAYLAATLGSPMAAQAAATPVPSIHALAPADSTTSVTLASALMPSDEENYTPLTIALSPVTAPTLANTDALTGEVVSAFDLTPASTFSRAELSLTLGTSLASDGDAIAVYRSDDSGATWTIHSYAAVHDHTIDLVLLGNAQATRFALVNKTQAAQTPTQVTSLVVNTPGAYTASGGITTNHRYLNKDNSYAARLEYHSTHLTYSASELADPDQRTNGITFASISTAPSPHFYFKNCTFDSLPMHFVTGGTYAFDHCTFVNCPGIGIDARAQGAHVYVMGCTFKDNNPDKDVWNQNKSGDRHSNYAAIRMRGQDATLHVTDSTFEHLQTDSTVIIQQNSPVDETGMEIYFQRNTMTRCGGAGLVMDNTLSGLIANNKFTEIGATRGTEGYDASDNAELAVNGNGKGVGGNAVFSRQYNPRLRVLENTINKVMENAIEGGYHSISRNYVNTTGYRYDEGYRTVSTEGIAAASSWYVTNNTVLNAHGRGIGISLWSNHPVRVTGNYVTRWEKGSTEESTSEGIKVRTDPKSYKNVYVADNILSGFEAAYRVIHSGTASGEVRCVSDVEIHDAGDDTLVSSVYRNMAGVQFRSEREVPIPFRTNSAAADSWLTSNVSSFAEGSDAGTSYVRLTAKPGDTHGRMWQSFDLPDEACVVCLKIKMRSNEPLVQAFSKSYDPATGNAYTSEGLGSYSETKYPITDVDSSEFRTYYVTFVARGRARLGLWVASDTQTIDVAEVRGWYTTNKPHGPARATGAPQASGRTATSVAALTSAAVSATASASFGDLTGASSYPATVHVKQFGAYGDGNHDDTAAIQAAFDSGASTVLFEKDGVYRCDSNLRLVHGDVTLLGNGATLLIDEHYSASYTSGGTQVAVEHFLDVHGNVPGSTSAREATADAWTDTTQTDFIRNVNIYQLKLHSKAFDPSLAPATRYTFSGMLRVMMAVNVDIWGCKFTIDERTPGVNEVNGYGSLDLYTGWHNVTIESCETDNRSNKTSGGGIWIRDHFNMGASNCVFAHNTMYKTSHDEMIAVYNNAPKRKEPGAVPRYIENVLISNNTITMRDGDPAATASVMALSSRNARGLLIENNTFDTWAEGGLFWARESTGIAIRNNTINHTKSVYSSPGFVIRTEEGPLIDEMSGNTVTFVDSKPEGSGKNYLVSGVRKAVGNKIVVSSPVEEVFSGARVVRNNEIQVNAATGKLFNGANEVVGNKVVANAAVSVYCQWYNRDLTRDPLVENNRFYNHASQSGRTILSLNQVRTNGQRVEFTGNTVVDDDVKDNARLIYAAISPASETPIAHVSGNAFSGTRGYNQYAGDNVVLMGDNSATPVSESEGVEEPEDDPGAGTDPGSDPDPGDDPGDEPGAETPDTAATPGTAETPATPLSPDSPLSPVTALSPDTPGTPASTTTPETPDEPDPTHTGWFVEDNRWHYRDAAGQAPDGWLWDGLWYRLDHGALITGWTWDNGWYYLMEDSSVAPQGSMRTGWLCHQGSWYYLNMPGMPGFSGLMLTGWVWDGNAWYYFSDSGAMLTGWVWDNGVWYFLDPGTGAWVW